jgi:glycosyltransferase involved in cell wall biosynthesis
MKLPLVSIIIPAYNAEVYVKEAVDSALRQTYRSIEVVVVDDGSTDGTKAVLRPYVRSGKINYIHQSNKGLSSARNAGIRASRGDFVAFLDSDDVFLETKVGEQLSALEDNPGFGVCYCDILHFTDTVPRRFYHHRYYYPSGDILEPLLHRQFINPLTVMARRELFEKYGYFDETLRRSEDWDLWLRWAHAGVKFYYLDKPLAHYRIRSEGNLSSLESEPAMKEKTLKLFTDFGKNLSDAEWLRYNYSGILKNLKLKTVFAYLIVGDKSSALLRARDVSWFWKSAVAALPVGLTKNLLVFLRRLKHRLLLKKL